MVATLLGGSSGLAIAQAEQNAEERFDEARAKPTPVGRQGNWIIVPIPVVNPTIGNGLQLAALYLHPEECRGRIVTRSHVRRGDDGYRQRRPAARRLP